MRAHERTRNLLRLAQELRCTDLGIRLPYRASSTVHAGKATGAASNLSAMSLDLILQLPTVVAVDGVLVLPRRPSCAALLLSSTTTVRVMLLTVNPTTFVSTDLSYRQ